MRELQSDVRPQPLGGDALDDVLVRRDDACACVDRRYVLAEDRRVRQEPVVVQPSQHWNGVVECLAGDEAGGAEPHAVSAHEPPNGRAVRRREDRATQDGVGGGGDGHDRPKPTNSGT